LRQKESLAPWEALPVFKQICAALIAAHEKGVVHRDIKPGNIMLDKSKDGEFLVKVLDFGSAQVLPMIGDTVLKLTQTGEMLGSLLYMSPEQCLDQDVDERSDCYSLGCLMYETLTGKPPLAARTAFETMNKQISEMPLPFSMVRPDLALPFPLQEIVFKSMAKSPENRYPSILDLLDDLDRLRFGPGELQLIAVRSSPEPAFDSSSSSSSEGLNKYLRQAVLELSPAPGIAHAETENVVRRSFIALFFIVVFPVMFAIATWIGLVSSFGALLFLSVFFVVFGFGWVIRAELRDAGRNSSLPSAEAVLKARKRVNVVVVAAYAISQKRIILEVSRYQNPGGTEAFKSELVVQPAEKSEKFWVQLTGTGGTGKSVSILPISADTVIDGDDRVLALVIGRHVAWVVS
jgi:serine/threonine protein kinase